MAHRGRSRRWSVTVDEIAEVVAPTGLTIAEFREALEDPASYGRPEVMTALFSLGALLVVQPDRRPAVLAAAEASLTLEAVAT